MGADSAQDSAGGLTSSFDAADALQGAATLATFDHVLIVGDAAGPGTGGAAGQLGGSEKDEDTAAVREVVLRRGLRWPYGYDTVAFRK